jgi:hypothetical protein
LRQHWRTSDLAAPVRLCSSEDHVPKSKVRKKPQAAASRAAAAALAANTTRAKVAGPSSPVYIGVMVGLMVLGLVWLVAYYLWGGSIPGIRELGNWNFGVGFVLMIVGLVMTMRWR